jgi:copper homeostasis protein
MILEICVDSVESAIAANAGGADRVELCSALREGGITPSIGLISAVRHAVSLAVFVLVRPRGGDFVYTEHEVEVMREDIRMARKAGADGVVLGVLTADGRVDVERTRSLIELARPLQVTFHRAFDVSVDLDVSLEEVIRSGADRLLTSGGEPNALLGMDRIAKLRAAAGDRLSVMAGAGIRQSNLRKLVESTGVCEIHTSLSTKTTNSTVHAGSRMKIGSHADEFSRFLVVEKDVRRLRSTLQAIRSGAEEEYSLS